MRKGLLALALAGAMASAAPAASSAVFDAKSFTLSNGLKVVVVANHRVPMVSHMVWYRVGSADEPPGKGGIAHFLEHLMFRGTATLAPGEFTRTVQRNGGRDNAFTSRDYTGYYQDVAADRLELVMRLEADRMVNLTLSDAVVVPERDVIIEERLSRIDNVPAAQFREQVQAALFLHHPYRLPVIGWLHEMRGLGREDALAFYRRHYAPNNAIVVVSGAVDAEEVKQLAERIYGPIPARELAARVRLKEPPQRVARRLSMEHPQVARPSFSRQYLAPSYRTADGTDAYALDLLAEILGGGETSRLHRRLALERGIALSVSAGYDGSAIDDTSFGFFATPAPGREMAELEAAIDAEIALLLAEGVQDRELKRAQTRLIDSAVFARDGVRGAASAIGTSLVIGLELAEIEAWPERIAAVTRTQVEGVARRVLDIRSSVTGILLPARRS
jgi:zinc protease